MVCAGMAGSLQRFEAESKPEKKCKLHKLPVEVPQPPQAVVASVACLESAA
jgi:hypothetical protein